jgi:hypothetical protein
MPSVIDQLTVTSGNAESNTTDLAQRREVALPGNQSVVIAIQMKEKQ